MRIISGRLKGRVFESPHGNRTHPMSDKVRGALFNMLGDINGLTVLDAFSGSGALSFEAISRGATTSVAVDIDKSAINTVVKNIENLGLSAQIKAIRANISGWSKNNPYALFDIVLCDPPYDQIKLSLLEKLATHAKPGGIIVYSLPPAAGFNLPTSNYHLLSSKSYGDARLVFYRKLE